ncbi:DICT sensory domain-containing protein [Haloarcula halobia]|nr:DICT sensory domain-containing protein [Halomicroarcula sp. XH51]
MSLHDLIEQVQQLEKDLVLFNVDSTDQIGERLAGYFETQNVQITTTRTASGHPAGVAVLSNHDEVLGRFDVETLRNLVDHSPSQSGTVGISDAEYGDILGHLKETTFTSYDTEQMLYASREIEDRARRVGEGTIHAGFQRCSVMADQRAIYADLSRRGLDIHAYGIADVAPPDIEGAQIHTTTTDEIAEMWFVVFDGGTDESQRSALLAEERSEDSFYGVWTYDPPIVDSVIDYLEQTYLLSENSARSSEI